MTREDDDMAFARNKILCGIADTLERIATQLEKPLAVYTVEEKRTAEEWKQKK
jgi:hypothetical protein